MSIVLREERGIIPRWRSLAVANETGELALSRRANIILPFESKVFVQEQERAFRDNRDIFHAGDLISSAFAIGVEASYMDVARFVMKESDDSFSPLRSLAVKILGINELVSPLDEKATVKSALDKQKHYGEIQRYKSYLKREPKNAIAWVELGRLYTLVNLLEKARRCIDIALQLDNNNRFIVRSASRFYTHLDSSDDRPLQIVKRAEFVKSDPWLLSAEIAYSTMLKRRSKLTKIAVDMVGREKSNFFSVTELSSALGTLELTNGTAKEAKRFFKTSLIEPNDNSVAQASFRATDLLGIDFDLSTQKLSHAFEAEAQLAYKHRRYQDAYDYALKWLFDEPFSHRPIRFAAHMLYTFLNNWEKAVDVLKQGLIVNSANVVLNNNLCYYLLKNDRVEEASGIFTSQLEPHILRESEVDIYTYIATAGLFQYRKGNFVEGKSLYQKAIDLIRVQKKGHYLLALATANFVEEEVRITTDRSKILLLKAQLDTVCEKSTEDEVEVIYRRLCKQILSKISQPDVNRSDEKQWPPDGG